MDNKTTEENLQDMFTNIIEIKERNKAIATAYAKGYSQHMIAKVLGLNQATVQRIIKRVTM